VNVVLPVPDEIVEEVARRAAAILAEKPAAAEPWLNVEQAAAHMGISASQLYSLCSARRTNGLPVTKEGSRNYFKASELDRWRERRGT